ncbi:MAG: DUF2079 domain-containing protein [Sandaracinaceae bacterium]|nr:DUF2079 domain-containing protein [Sandaracinaceae bacterium]
MRRLEWAGWIPVLIFGSLGALRFSTLHNQTFDLAFYARMAHGMARGDLYDPIVGAHVLGLHLSPILLPLGLLGLLFGQVPVLLLAQTLSTGLAAQGLARLGAQRLGSWGALTGLVFALHPNVGHVLSYEFHPGTLALAPLVGSLLALDRGDARAFVWATLGVLACREDLAAITALTGLVALLQPRSPAMRAAGRGVFMGSLLWLVVFVGMVAPRFAPAAGGSLDAHFGHLGGSFGSALAAVFTQPAAVLAHLTQPDKLSYLPRVLAPLLFLPLLAPRFLLPALPVLGMLMLSQFETTTQLRSHYLTPAVPALVWAAVHGFAQVKPHWQRQVGVVVLGATLVTFVLAGVGPLSLRFFAPYYREDARTEAGRAVLAVIPPDASVQAPDVLLPHLAERQTVHRAAPPERRVDFWVLDVSHRDRYAGQGTLLRTSEEPRVRDLMARSDRGVLLYRPPFVVLERGRDPRAALAAFEDTGAGPIAGEHHPGPVAALHGVALAITPRRHGDPAGPSPAAADLAWPRAHAQGPTSRCACAQRPRPRRVELPVRRGAPAVSPGTCARGPGFHTPDGPGDGRIREAGAVASSRGPLRRVGAELHPAIPDRPCWLASVASLAVADPGGGWTPCSDGGGAYRALSSTVRQRASGRRSRKKPQLAR